MSNELIPAETLGCGCFYDSLGRLALPCVAHKPALPETAVTPRCDYENESEGSGTAFVCELPMGHTGSHAQGDFAKRRLAETAGTRTEQPNVQAWTCFHCSETFTTFGSARDHFGASPDAVAGCLIDRVAVEEGGKPERGRGLLMALRKAEARIAEHELARQASVPPVTPNWPPKQADLPESAAKVLRDNLWQLYEGEAVPTVGIAPIDTSIWNGVDDLPDLMNAGRWQEATMLLIRKVDALYRASAPSQPGTPRDEQDVTVLPDGSGFFVAEVGDTVNAAVNSCDSCEPVFWNQFNGVTQCHRCGRTVTGTDADVCEPRKLPPTKSEAPEA